MLGDSQLLSDGCPGPGVPTVPGSLEASSRKDSGATGCGQNFPQCKASRTASSPHSGVQRRWQFSPKWGPRAPRKAAEKQPVVARFNEPSHIILHICIARFSVHHVFTSFISSDPWVGQRVQAWRTGLGGCCLHWWKISEQSRRA